MHLCSDEETVSDNATTYRDKLVSRYFN